MIGIQYKNEFLDVDPRASLSWELHNLIFSSSDSSKLPGSFSFPFTIPNTQTNRRLLNYPDRIDNESPFVVSETVSIHENGQAIFHGTMKVTEAGVNEVKLYIVANPLSELKTTPLNQLSLGGVRTFADAATVLTHAKATALNPLDYDYVFFPVWNRAFLEELSDDPRGRFQNFYNSTSGAFEVDDKYPALMPFVRLEYLLGKIFEGQEYSFENRFQVNNELKQICLYTNKSMWTSEGLDTEINLQDYVSETAASSFVRKLMGAFCLGLFYNPWDKVLRLIPINTVLEAEVKHDWTSKLLYAPTITSGLEQPESICWQRDDSDGAWAHYDKYTKPASIDDELTWAELLLASAGTYYVTDRHAYYQKITSPTRYFFKYTTLGCAPVEDGDPTFNAELQALWDVFLYGEGWEPVTNGNYDLVPHCRIPGTVEYEYTPTVGDPEIRQQQNDIPDRMTIYRGMYDDFDGDDYPLASGLPWDGSGNLIGSYSLRWDGEYGMYENWWKNWHNMLRNGKNVTALVKLTLADILSFNFEDKVRVYNQEFIVKKMKVSISPYGLEPVEVELVSTI